MPDEAPEEPPIPDRPPDVAMVVDEAEHDSGESVVIADAFEENLFVEGVAARGAESEMPMPADAGRLFADDDSSDDIQIVLDATEKQSSGYFDEDSVANEVGRAGAEADDPQASAHSHVVETELMELRLALEASQAELTHLTASRDHLASVVTQYEQLIEQLRQEAGERESQHAHEQEAFAAQVADIRQQSAVLEARLEQTSAQLEIAAEQLASRGSASEEHVERSESQQAAMFELRELLGQYEATQASLQREKLDFATQVRDWQQKADRLESELERVRQESAAAEQAEPTMPPPAPDTSQELQELQYIHQQAVADLSLANESVKQLNQQLMLRDAAFAQLDHQKQHVDRQLAELNEQLEQLPEPSVTDNQVADPDLVRAELEAVRAELQAAQQQTEQAREELELLQPGSEANESLQAKFDHQQLLITQLAEDCNRFQNEHQSNLKTIEELRSDLARLAEASEEWQAERVTLLQRLDMAEADELGTVPVVDVQPAGDEEGQAQLQRLQSLLEDRDRAYGELQTRLAELEETQHLAVAQATELRAKLAATEQTLADAVAQDSPTDTTASDTNKVDALVTERDRAAAAAAEASATIAELLAEVASHNEHSSRLEQENVLLLRRADEAESLSQKLSEENAEYRESVAQLQADANALAEVELMRDRERVEFEDRLKQLTQGDARIQDVAARLSQARGEVASLNSELLEQQAIVHALREGRETQSRPIENGQPAPRRDKKRTAKPRDTTAMRTDARSSKDDDHPPEQVDDLQKINGVGPVLEKRLHEVGIYRYAQIKEWTKSDVEHLDKQLKLRGRIVRDRWVQQARQLSR